MYQSTFIQGFLAPETILLLNSERNPSNMIYIYIYICHVMPLEPRAGEPVQPNKAYDYQGLLGLIGAYREDLAPAP